MIKLPFSEILPCGVCDFDSVGELLNCRAKQRIPKNSASVIMYLFPYYLGEEYYKNSNISKYAVPEDYHRIAGAYLEKAADELRKAYPKNVFQAFCDNSPIKEVEVAVKCGLGVKGKNTLLINKDYGSFVFIGEIITDLKITPSLPEDRTCLSCGLCENICPSGALVNYKVNRDKCLSSITQLKGELSCEQSNLIAENSCIWGCDKCQDICPMNKNIKKSPVKEFYETAKSSYSLGDDISTRAFNWRGKSVIERNFKINCCKDKQNNL